MHSLSAYVRRCWIVQTKSDGCRDLSEHLLDGLHVSYNSFAKHPLPIGAFQHPVCHKNGQSVMDSLVEPGRTISSCRGRSLESRISQNETCGIHLKLQMSASCGAPRMRINLLPRSNADPKAQTRGPRASTARSRSVAQRDGNSNNMCRVLGG